MTRTRLARWITSALVAGAVAVGYPAAAAAHVSETTTRPEAGAILDLAPREVEVRFDSPLLDVGAALVVRSADDTSITVGTPRVGRDRITVDVDPDAPPGEYTVAYRVVSKDGHTVESTFRYTVAGTPDASLAASTEPSDPASSPPQATTGSPSPEAVPTASATVAAVDSEGGGPPYALIAAGLLVLTLAGAGAIALRR